MSLLINLVFALIMAVIAGIVLGKLKLKHNDKKIILNAEKAIEKQKEEGYKYIVDGENVNLDLSDYMKENVQEKKKQKQGSKAEKKTTKTKK